MNTLQKLSKSYHNFMSNNKTWKAKAQSRKKIKVLFPFSPPFLPYFFFQNPSVFQRLDESVKIIYQNTILGIA